MPSSTLKISSKLIVLQELSSEERAKISKELFLVNQQIFGNSSYEEFCHYISYSAAEKTYLMLYRNEQKALVGFFALHIFRISVEGKSHIIFRGQTGLLQAYRRSKANMYFALFKIIRYRFLHPFASIYCFLAVLSPSMYAVLAKNLLLLKPRFNRTASTKEVALREKLRIVFDFKKDERCGAWNSPIGWVSLASEKELAYWKSSQNPHIQFYLSQNPYFQEGYGLITLIPFSWSNILVSSLKVLAYILKKAFFKK